MAPARAKYSQDNLEEFGFDWILGPFNVGSDSFVGQGGTLGSTRGVPAPGSPPDFPVIPGGPVTSLVTSGLRSGGNAVQSNNLDAVIANLVEKRGHIISTGEPQFAFGGAQLIYRLDNGVYCAASDHRKDGQAVGF